MKKLTVFVAVMVFLIIASCAPGIQVSYDYDKSVDFSKYETFEYFGWAEGSDKVLNQFNKERIEQAAGEEFAKRGLQYVEDGGDLVVSLFIVFDEKKGVTAYTDHYGGSIYGRYGYGPGWGWGYGYSTTRYHEYDYLVGTLVIDVFDKSTKKLIWQGVGSKTVDENPQNREKKIRKAVASIMNNFPVKPSEE